MDEHSQLEVLTPLERLTAEYHQWNELYDILNKLKEKVKDFHLAAHRNQKHRLIQTFGRWLMLVQHCDWEQLDDRYPLFQKQPFSDSVSKTELIRMIQECFRDMTFDTASVLVDVIMGRVDSFLNTSKTGFNYGKLEVRYETDNQGAALISIGGFRTPMCSQVSYLTNKLCKTSTAKVCLRYEPLNWFVGGESSLSEAAFDALYDIGQARYEGFSSPLNSGLMNKVGTKFCSLFEDTDAPFGSLGNFFRINLMDHPGGWILDPPFVEQVLESVAHRVIKTLDETEPGSFWFFVLFPTWEDFIGWKTLEESHWNVETFVFKPKDLSIRNCYGKTYTMHITVNMFVMGQLPNDVDVNKLYSSLLKS